jgi:hypothetical protein
VPQIPWANWDLLNRALAKMTGINELKGLVNLQAAAEMAESEALARDAERQESDGPQPAKNVGSGQRSGPSPQAQRPQMQSPTQNQGGGQNAAKPKTQPLPGKASGGSYGNKAASSAGAA